MLDKVNKEIKLRVRKRTYKRKLKPQIELATPEYGISRFFWGSSPDRGCTPTCTPCSPCSPDHDEKQCTPSDRSCYPDCTPCGPCSPCHPD